MKKVVIGLLAILSVTVGSNGQSVKDIGDRLTTFLNTLSNEQRQEISYSFNDTSRTNWTNLPVGIAPRPGIRYGEFSEVSKLQFHRLLTTLLSSQGYLKITGIMQLDDILNVIYESAYRNKEIDEDVINEIRDLKWDYTNYYVSVWGNPEHSEPWGFKLEGHHISLNCSAIDGHFSVTPFFLGTDPSEVHTTKYAGIRVLSKEEDYGFRLINSLSDQQQAIATLSKDVPGDIITSPKSEQRITNYEGIKASDLNPRQLEFLKYIIEEYINNLEHEKAHEYLDKFYATSLDSIYFAWIGSYVSRKPHYYVINTPDFLIEYDNMGFQRNGNHIHSIWREKGNDFGKDILKEHYSEHKH